MSEVKESAPKHTAGWHVSPKAVERGDFPVLDWSGRAVCLAVEEGEARLIAAAPDLLEALVASQGIEPLRMELEDCLPDEREALVAELQQIEAQVRAAIAKATEPDQ